MFERILIRSTGLLQQIYHHPFNQQLNNGTLPKDTFRFFLEQDALYLKDFSLGLAHISKRLDRLHLSQQFFSLSQAMIATELNLLKKYLKEPPQVHFFSTPTNTRPTKIPIIDDYTTYLLHMTSQSSIAEAVASCTPCFWIYHQLGKNMAPNLEDTNPYNAWIKSYSSQKFSAATSSVVATLNELTHPIKCPIIEEQIMHAFIQSANFEKHFLDGVMQGKINRTGFPLSLRLN